MATLAQGPVTSSDAQYRTGYSSRLFLESIINNPLNRIFVDSSVINVENDLTVNKGGTVTMYNDLKINGKGYTGDIDIYSNAQLFETSSRTMNIALNTLPITWPMKGTQSNQFTPFDIGENKEKKLQDWGKALYTVGLINQAAGNTATSITQYTLDTSAFSGSDLTRVTGNNAAVVPTRWYWGNVGGAVTTDASLTNSYPLTLKDFQLATEIITSQPAAGPAFQTVSGKSYLAVAVIGYTGMNQMINEAVTAEQGMQLSQVIRAQLQGGGTVEDQIDSFMVPGIPLKFVVVPDTWLPRGVNVSTGAEVANTRRAVILGANALDVSFGAGYAPPGGKVIPGANVEFDTVHKKLNNQGYGKVSMLWGCKKTQTTGAGTGNSTAYDLSTYVISHYSRT